MSQHYSSLILPASMHPPPESNGSRLSLLTSVNSTSASMIFMGSMKDSNPRMSLASGARVANCCWVCEPTNLEWRHLAARL